MEKNIMLIVPMLDQGGLERVCAMTAQLLKETFQVHLVVFNTKGMIYDVSGVHLLDLQMGASEGKLGKVINVFKRASAVKKLKKKYQIDIAYSFGTTANITNVLSKGIGKAWIGIRGYGALDNKKVMSFTCKRADRVISCTKVMEADINSQFRVNSSSVLYNPCDIFQIERSATEKINQLKEGNTKQQLEAFEEFVNKPGKIVVSTGREHDVKGFWHLIKAVYLVKKNIPDLKLMIIGAGDYTEYKKLATDLGIANDVLFTGVQKNPFSLMSKADVYALTSDSEGFPNSLIEAMACGLPCVSVNCKTGPAEILGELHEKYSNQSSVYDAEYGILTPVFKGNKNLDASVIDEEEKIFAKELERLLSDEELYQKYCDMAKQRVQTYSKEAYQNEIIKMIRTEA